MNQIKTINTKTKGFSMDIHENASKIVLTDPYKFIAVYDYSNYEILPVSRYFGPFFINDAAFINGSVIYGDRGGKVNILEFNLENLNSDIHKSHMTNVGEIYVGEEIFTIRRIENKFQHKGSKNNECIYYGCSSGTIGKIKTIS